MNFRPIKELANDACLVLCIGFVALSLAACGRRGDPLPPPGVPEDRSPPMINETTTGTLDSNNCVAAHEDATPAAAGAAPVVKRKKPFVLDPLL